jgi:hypothetical protein
VSKGYKFKQSREEMTDSKAACRLHVLLAKDADIGIVFRRGPTAWWHILKWDLAKFTLERGAWLKGTLYPTRSAVSPDGKVIAYFAMQGSWDTYLAVSKPPWLKALCAWKTVGTWTTGAYFKCDGTLCAFGALCEEKPFHGSCAFPFKFGGTDTNWNRAREFQFMMNGWKPKASDESVENFNPGPNEVIELSKSSFQNPKLVLNKYSEFGSCLYSMTYPDNKEILISDAVWADFDRKGRLVIASATGELRIYEINDSNMTTVFSVNLNSLKPNPVKAPLWASRW